MGRFERARRYGISVTGGAAGQRASDDAWVGGATDVLVAVLPRVARAIEACPTPHERDLKQVVRESLHGSLTGLTLSPIEHKLTLEGWPNLGPVDVAIEAPERPPLLVELKWGAGTLFNCAWDAVKLALASAEHAASLAFMVAGAPASDWSSGTLGSELFADSSWDTAEFMKRHASGFAKWRRDVKTRPSRLPSAFRSHSCGSQPLTIQDQPWEIRMVEIGVDPGCSSVDIDQYGRVSR